MSRFQQITPRVQVTDLQRTIQFYQKYLGFSVYLAWPEEQPKFCILQRDQISIGFHAPDEHRPARTTGGCEFSIEVEDVQGLYATLKDKVPIDWGPEVYFYGRREFAILDPDGYMLIFTEPTDDPPTCPDE